MNNNKIKNFYTLLKVKNLIIKHKYIFFVTINYNNKNEFFETNQ